MQQTHELGKKIGWIIALSILVLAALTYTPTFARKIIDENYSLYERHTVITYKIKKGDTLWAISKKYGVTVDELKKANQLTSDLIITGKILYIPQTISIVHTDRIPSMKKDGMQIASLNKQIAYSEEDRYWLAKIIEAEAGIEPLEGKIAVGAVVMNRIEEEWFPDTIQEVIFQKFNGKYQFSPVGNGRIYKVEPSEESYEAADRALAGEDPTDGALYFYNPKISKSTFFKNRELLISIGNHQFFQ